MSQGAFVASRYAADYGTGTQIHPVRVQPETLQLSLTIGGTAVLNTAPIGAATSPISATITRSRRSLGLNTAKIAFKFTGTPPTGYSANQRLVLPALNKPIRAATFGTVGTYLGAAVQVISVLPEAAR
jgi:hypothetical protein